MRKYDIVNAIGRKRGYRTYLEICTPLTGWTFARVDRARFTICHRLLYRCPRNFEDGAEITFRTEHEDVAGLIGPNARYDCIFVDPFHSFECSYGNLEMALSLLGPRGSIVVHDCSPATPQIARPSFQEGAWCGVTYCAYIEFILAHPELSYYTVDTDCGCGVIRKETATQAAATREPESRRALRELWRIERSQTDDMFSFFDQHRRELLKLVSVREFRAHEQLRRSWIWELKELADRGSSWTRRRVVALLPRGPHRRRTLIS